MKTWSKRCRLRSVSVPMREDGGQEERRSSCRFRPKIGPESQWSWLPGMVYSKCSRERAVLCDWIAKAQLGITPFLLEWGLMLEPWVDVLGKYYMTEVHLSPRDCFLIVRFIFLPKLSFSFPRKTLFIFNNLWSLCDPKVLVHEQVRGSQGQWKMHAGTFLLGHLFWVPNPCGKWDKREHRA